MHIRLTSRPLSMLYVSLHSVPKSDAEYNMMVINSYRTTDYFDQSSTAQLLNGSGVPLNFSYGSGDVLGEYITDNIAVGRANLTNVIIGLATNDINEQRGILGVGLPADEVPDIPKHAGVLELLVEQGYIRSTSYSLYLDSYSKPSLDSSSLIPSSWSFSSRHR